MSAAAPELVPVTVELPDNWLLLGGDGLPDLPHATADGASPDPAQAARLVQQAQDAVRARVRSLPDDTMRVVFTAGGVDAIGEVRYGVGVVLSLVRIPEAAGDRVPEPTFWRDPASEEPPTNRFVQYHYAKASPQDRSIAAILTFAASAALPEAPLLARFSRIAATLDFG